MKITNQSINSIPEIPSHHWNSLFFLFGRKPTRTILQNYLSFNQSQSTMISAQSGSKDQTRRSRPGAGEAMLPSNGKRNWPLCVVDSLSRRDRYPIKFDNRFTLVTRVVEYTRGHKCSKQECLLTVLE